jgi:hypothetical protein
MLILPLLSLLGFLQTSLQVISKCFIQFIPTHMDGWLTQSNPSARFDPVALELYGAIMSKVSPICPVGDNASGDYWRRIRGIVAMMAPSVGSLISALAPEAAPVVSAGSALVAAIAKMNKNKKKKTPLKTAPARKATPQSVTPGRKTKQPM